MTPDDSGSSGQHSLRNRVRTCRACLDSGEQFLFELDADGCPKKFPPTIGADGQTKLLFMALCPRPTNNYVLDWAMSGPEQFEQLALNRNQDGENYLESYDREGFYRPFVEIAAAAYPNNAFCEVAAVTDLYFCALPSRELRAKSPCADLHFEDLIASVRPTAIITKGNRSMHYFKKFVGRTCQYRTAYRIEVGGITTTLLPVEWGLLDRYAYEPAKSWLLEQIALVDDSPKDNAPMISSNGF